jgi:hypothetical protein
LENFDRTEAIRTIGNCDLTTNLPRFSDYENLFIEHRDPAATKLKPRAISLFKWISHRYNKILPAPLPFIFNLKWQRGGKWYVFVNYHGRRKAKCVGSSRLIAEQVKRQLEAKLALGDLGFLSDSPEEPTFGTFAEELVEDGRPALQAIDRGFLS